VRACPSTPLDRLRVEFDALTDSLLVADLHILRLQSEKRALLAANQELQAAVQALIKQRPVGPLGLVVRH
jgi:hypothetical protein